MELKTFYLRLKSIGLSLYPPLIVIYIIIPIISILQYNSNADKMLAYLYIHNAIDLYVPIMCAWWTLCILVGFTEDEQEAIKCNAYYQDLKECGLALLLFLLNVLVGFSFLYISFSQEFYSIIFLDEVKTIIQSVFFAIVAYSMTIFTKSTLFTLFSLILYCVIMTMLTENRNIFINIFSQYRFMTYDIIVNKYLTFLLIACLALAIAIFVKISRRNVF